MSNPDNPDVSGAASVPDVPQVPQVPQVPDVPQVPPIPGQYATGSSAPPPVGSYPNAPGAYGATAHGYGDPGYVTVAPPRQPVLSIISMVAGIVAVLGLPVVFVPVVGGILGLFVPAAAVVLGFLGRTREPQAKGFWLTGIIAGAVAAVIALISVVVWVVVFATLPSGSMNMNMNDGPF